MFCDCNLREPGSEFQRTLPEYTRLDLERSVLVIGILSFPECRDWFRKKLTVCQNSLVVVKPLFEGKNRQEVIV